MEYLQTSLQVKDPENARIQEGKLGDIAES